MADIKVPVLAESVSEATLMKWHKKQGDPVKRGDNLIDIETDKVTLEVAALNDGVLTEILKGDGETVESDEVIARIDEVRGGQTNRRDRRLERVKRLLGFVKNIRGGERVSINQEEIFTRQNLVLDFQDRVANPKTFFLLDVMEVHAVHNIFSDPLRQLFLLMPHHHKNVVDAGFFQQVDGIVEKRFSRHADHLERAGIRKRG